MFFFSECFNLLSLAQLMTHVNIAAAQPSRAIDQRNIPIYRLRDSPTDNGGQRGANVESQTTFTCNHILSVRSPTNKSELYTHLSHGFV